MGERLDLRVHDSVALDEIELYAEVLSAVAASDHPLTLEELDEVLGIRGRLTMLDGAWPSSRYAVVLPGGRAPRTPRFGSAFGGQVDSSLALVTRFWCYGWPAACWYMTSVAVCAKPSEAYSRIAAVFSPST